MLESGVWRCNLIDLGFWLFSRLYRSGRTFWFWVIWICVFALDWGSLWYRIILRVIWGSFEIILVRFQSFFGGFRVLHCFSASAGVSEVAAGFKSVRGAVATSSFVSSVLKMYQNPKTHPQIERWERGFRFLLYKILLFLIIIKFYNR